jgi:hypothetical protein
MMAPSVDRLSQLLNCPAPGHKSRMLSVTVLLSSRARRVTALPPQ